MAPDGKSDIRGEVNWKEKTSWGEWLFFCGLAIVLLYGCSRIESRQFDQELRQAQQGKLWSQQAVAIAYFSGKGVRSDYKEAVRWYRMAASRGLAQAQFLLGMCYLNGHGVDQSNYNAFLWFAVAFSNPTFQASEQSTIDLCERLMADFRKLSTPEEYHKAQQESLQLQNEIARIALDDPELGPVWKAAKGPRGSPSRQ